MARLKTVKSRLRCGRSRIDRGGGDATERSRERDRSHRWRAWYKTKRWRLLRIEILKRDRWTCQATGVLLTGKHPAANAPVVDHKIPHRGDERLFWDPENLQAVSKAYHDSEKQRQEKRGETEAEIKMGIDFTTSPISKLNASRDAVEARLRRREQRERRLAERQRRELEWLCYALLFGMTVLFFGTIANQ